MAGKTNAGKRSVQVPRPDRVRCLDGVLFGWADVRLLRDGWLQVITPQATSLYFLLCLAANREGVSFYSRARMGRELGLDDEEVCSGLQRLREVGLIAYRPFSARSPDGFHQVLPVPSGGAPRPLAPIIEALAKRLQAKIDVTLPDPENDPILRKEGWGRGR